MGVWIEISQYLPYGYILQVTPFMGVWIEITGKSKDGKHPEKSHPLWVCGLKYFSLPCPSIFDSVTPFMGVWIEIIISLI